MRHELSKPKPKQPLYQVIVQTKSGRLPVGPMMTESVCSILAGQIAEQIRLGREKTWRDPQVIPIITEN